MMSRSYLALLLVTLLPSLVDAQPTVADFVLEELPEHVVASMEARDHWFAAKVEKDESYALVGCTVAPGFDFEDFTLGERDTLMRQYLDHQKIIAELTR